MIKSFIAAVCLSLALATSASAAPINLDFEFGGASGTIYGLDDSDGSYTASSFDLKVGSTTWSGLPAFTAPRNDFFFLSGELFSAEFLFNLSQGSDDFREVLFEFEFTTVGIDVFGTADTSLSVESGVARISISSVAAVPLPAAGLLLLSTFGGFAALKRRKKRGEAR